jgi:hypothetical protein
MGQVQIAHGKIDVIGQRLGFLAARRDVYQGQYHRAAIDIVTRRSWNPPARIIQQLPVKLSRLIEIGYLQDYAEKAVSHF